MNIHPNPVTVPNAGLREIALSTEHALQLTVTQARLALRAAINDRQDSGLLEVAFHSVVAAEAVASIRSTVKHLVRTGADAAQVRDALLTALLAGPGDDQPGRGNDTRRVAFDATRAEVQRLIQHI